MSHLVKIDTELRDVDTVQAACNRLGLSNPVQRTVNLFSGEATGWAVELPDWRYPIVCDTETGQTRFDNYNGHWGDQKELDRFLQAYAVEKTRIETRKKGHTVTEEQLADGSIKLTVQINGGAT